MSLAADAARQDLPALAQVSLLVGSQEVGGRVAGGKGMRGVGVHHG